ncbi:MAG: tetratricopeptide repeat protein, partial [Candidatus Aquicultor sp.]
LKGSMVVAVIFSAVSAYYALAMYIADYNYATAIQLGNEGQVEAAINNYERSIGLYQNGRYYDGYGMFLDRVGVMQQNREMINKAIAVYQAAQIYEPLEGDHYVFLASGHAKLATGPKDPMLDTAVAELQQGISVRPQAYSARILLANVYMFQGKHQQAIDTLKFVLEIRPQEKTAFQIMAKCYQQMGNKKEALKYYTKYLALQPDDQDAKAAVQLLEKK